MNNVFLLLGSNVGDRHAQLENGCQNIGSQLGKIILASSIYETEPWGNTEQASFLNQVVLMETMVGAHDLMKKIILVEEQMGRKRIDKWEPRIIDIDILFFNDDVINTERLVIPHPSLHLRRFSLVPLVELMPDYVHPVLKKPVSMLLAELTDPLEVKKITANFA